MVALTFDARTVEPVCRIDPVPAGWYNVMVDETELRPTKKGDGAYLNVRFNILDGQYANQKIFTRLNLQNPSIQAKEIAFKQLSAVCHAIGVLTINDSAELHGRPLKIRVKVRKDEEYGDSNDVTSYKNINEPTPGSGPAAAPTAAPAAPVAAAPVAAPPQGWGPTAAPVAAPAAAPVAAPVPAAPVVAAPPARDPSYQYTPDGLQRWKPGMPAWELVPVAAAPAPAPAAPQGNGAWTPPAAAQPWQAAPAPAAPQPTAPAAAPAPQQPTPPWQTPRS